MIQIHNYQTVAFWSGWVFLLAGIVAYYWGYRYGNTKESWDGFKGMYCVPGALMMFIGTTCFLTSIHWAAGFLMITAFATLVWMAAHGKL